MTVCISGPLYGETLSQTPSYPGNYTLYTFTFTRLLLVACLALFAPSHEFLRPLHSALFPAFFYLF